VGIKGLFVIIFKTRLSLKPLPQKIGVLLFWALVTVCGTGMAATKAHAPRQILIVYSGNTLGELKPCGCAREEDQGGIERRMGYMEEVRTRKKNTLIVDTGDNFKEPTRQGKIKARFLLKAMSEMKYDAVTFGDHDFVYGNSFISEQEGIPWVLSNMESSLPIAKVRVKTFDDDLTVAVIAVADPDLLYENHHSAIRVTDPRSAVESQIHELAKIKAPDLIVLLTHMKRDKALRFLDIEGVDVVINGHIEKDTDVIDMKPVRKDGKIFVQPGPRGQKMGELLVTFPALGEKSFAQKMTPLGSKVPLSPRMTELYEVYNQEIEELFFASLSQRKNKKKKLFATEAVCKTCHPKAHNTWQRSRHGNAYSTLRKVNKAFDPECLACHVTGWNQPGGFISEIDTPGLKNVQCEVCHGPALKHSEAPSTGFGQDARQACKNCHVKNHSPRFDFDTYWEKIKH
jgi:cytochrome c554/c'-like protein/calcineurin-like phosphoesterase family protein